MIPPQETHTHVHTRTHGPRLPPPRWKPHTNTLIAGTVLTTTGSNAVRAFETQLMLYNRGLSLNLLHPTTSQRLPTPPPWKWKPHGAQAKCLRFETLIYSFIFSYPAGIHNFFHVLIFTVFTDSFISPFLASQTASPLVYFSFSSCQRKLSVSSTSLSLRRGPLLWRLRVVISPERLWRQG